MRGRATTCLAIALLGAGGPRAALAQPAPTGVVTGHAADSLARRMLPGALIEAVGTGLVARADAQGLFRLVLPAGRHALRLAHPAVDALGDLTLPDVVVDVPADDSVFAPLAIPAAATLYRALCGTPPPPGGGVLVGTLRDAVTDTPLGGVDIVVGWSELLVQGRRGALAPTLREVRGKSAESGQYRLCALPNDIALSARFTRAARTVDVNDLALAGEPFGVIDLSLRLDGADTAVATARITGRITADGRPVENVAVFVAGLEHLTTSDSAGRYLLTAVPAGPQRVEFRSVGFAPTSITLNVRPGSLSERDVRLEPVRVLAASTVTARPIAIWDSVGFEERRRRGGGTFVDAEMLKGGSIDFTSALRSFSGFQTRGNALRATAVDSPDRGGCTPTFYVDGVMIESRGGTGAPQWLRPEQIRAMEIYRSRGQIPPRFARPETCGAIVVWTRNRYLEEEAARPAPARPPRPPR